MIRILRSGYGNIYFVFIQYFTSVCRLSLQKGQRRRQTTRDTLFPQTSCTPLFGDPKSKPRQYWHAKRECVSFGKSDNCQSGSLKAHALWRGNLVRKKGVKIRKCVHFSELFMQVIQAHSIQRLYFVLKESNWEMEKTSGNIFQKLVSNKFQSIIWVTVIRDFLKQASPSMKMIHIQIQFWSEIAISDDHLRASWQVSWKPYLNCHASFFLPFLLWAGNRR